jgi:hypothetical protein
VLADDQRINAAHLIDNKDAFCRAFEIAITNDRASETMHMALNMAYTPQPLPSRPPRRTHFLQYAIYRRTAGGNLIRTTHGRTDEKCGNGTALQTAPQYEIRQLSRNGPPGTDRRDVRGHRKPPRVATS